MMSWDRIHHPDNSENVVDDDAIPPWKTVAALVVVVACLATVYPTMIHPVIVGKLGIGNAGQGHQNIDDFQRSTPRPIGVPPGRSVGSADRFANIPSSRREAMSPFPGPQIDIHAHQQMTSTKSNWHWILPFYTIGVVIFLLYTLGKIIFKQPSKNRRQYNFRYDMAKECFEVNGANDLLNKTMEDLAQCANLDQSTSATNVEMQRLQNRLVETENAMQKILSQLDTLTRNFDPLTASAVKMSSKEALQNVERMCDKPTCDMDFRNRNASAEETSLEEEPYIRDLNKAFSDFQKFTDAYLRDKCRQTNEKYESYTETDHFNNDDFQEALSGEEVCENDDYEIQINSGLRHRNLELDS